jgi:hypothetical protein
LESQQVLIWVLSENVAAVGKTFQGSSAAVHEHLEPGELNRNSDGLRAGRRGSIPGRVKIFFLLHSLQTGSGAHPVSFQIGTGDLSPMVNRPGREADHSPPSSAETQINGAISPLPRMSSWRSA